MNKWMTISLMFVLKSYILLLKIFLKIILIMLSLTITNHKKVVPFPSKSVLLSSDSQLSATAPVTNTLARSSFTKPVKVFVSKLALYDPKEIKKFGDALKNDGIVSVVPVFSMNEVYNLRPLMQKVFQAPLDYLKNFSVNFEKIFPDKTTRRGFNVNSPEKKIRPLSDTKYENDYSMEWELSDNYNIYPSDDVCPGLEKKTESVRKKLQETSTILKNCLSVYLKDDSGLLDVMNYIRDPKSEAKDSFKFIYAPASSPDVTAAYPDNMLFRRKYAHRDSTALFTMFLGKTLDGLQYKHPESKQWYDIDKDPDSFVVIPGGQLKAVTANIPNNRFPEVVHRVITDKSGLLNDRLSTTYFCRLNPFRPYFDLNTGKLLKLNNTPIFEGRIWDYFINSPSMPTEEQYLQYKAEINQQWQRLKSFFNFKQSTNTISKN
jgi:isopenicillin N synthase-like dioxygenase